MQNLTLENVVTQCLVACELLSREGKGLPHDKLKIGIESFYTEDGQNLSESRLEMLCKVVSRVMRASGLVIEHDDTYFWKDADNRELN